MSNIGVEHVLRAPAYPINGRAIWKKLRDALASEQGCEQSIPRVASALGIPISTAGYWLSAHNQAHVMSFVALLERLSEAERSRLLLDLCRPLPTLLHPRLAYSTTLVAALVGLLKKPRSLIVIRGEPSMRNFLATALGHAFPQIDHQCRLPGGLDVHHPEKFVPVEGLLYVGASVPAHRLRIIIAEVWPDIEASKAPLLIFNGVWSASPERRDQILAWAEKRLVVVADSEVPSPGLCAQLPSCHMLEVSPQVNHPTRIRVNIQTPAPSAGRPRR